MGRLDPRMISDNGASDGQALVWDDTSGLWLPATIVNSLNGDTGALFAYTTVEDEGSALTQRPTLDFQGSGVSVADDATHGKTIVTVSGGGAGTAGRSTRVYRTASMTTTTTWTTIGFDNETRDELSGHDNSTSNSTIVIPADGRYRITGQAGAVTTTKLALRILVDAVSRAVILTGTGTSSENVAQVTTGLLDLTSGQAVTMQINCFAGATLDNPSEANLWLEVEQVT